MDNPLILSTLPKTWILDLDGTLVKHNGYLSAEGDQLLPGAKEFLANIPQDDYILIVTSRQEDQRASTAAFLNHNKIRYDKILFAIPQGERIVVNDKKPSGIDMAVAINIERNNLSVPQIIREL